MLLSLAVPLASAKDLNEKAEVIPAVTPATYQTVATRIIEAEEETEIQFRGEEIHYYWGDGFFVAKDDSGYYFVEYNKDFTNIKVNGRPIQVIQRASNEITYPTSWVTSVDKTWTFPLGDLPLSAATGLVISVIGAYISKNMSVTIATSLASTLAVFLVNGFFPGDSKLTVSFLWKYRIIESALPTIIEHYKEVEIYYGKTNDLFQDLIYGDSETYEEVSYAD